MVEVAQISIVVEVPDCERSRFRALRSIGMSMVKVDIDLLAVKDFPLFRCLYAESVGDVSGLLRGESQFCVAVELTSPAIVAAKRVPGVDFNLDAVTYAWIVKQGNRNGIIGRRAVILAPG